MNPEALDHGFPHGPDSQLTPPTMPLRVELNIRLGYLRTERSSWIATYQELGAFFSPRQARFWTADRNRGQKKHNNIIDGTPMYAARVTSSGMMGGITSPSRPWFIMKTIDADLNQNGAVQEWLSKCRDIILQIFLRSNLYTVLPTVYLDLAIFGTSSFSVLEDPTDVIRCYHWPVGSYMIGNGPRNTVDTFYREFQMQVVSIVRRFGWDRCPREIRSLYQTRAWDQWVDVVHAVEPNPDDDGRFAETSKKPFRSVYYYPGGSSGSQQLRVSDEDAILSLAGYDEFPVIAPRWYTYGEDIYGSSPGMDVLGDAKQLQTEHRKKLQAIEKGLDPPLKAPVSLRGKRINTLPGEVTYYNPADGDKGLSSLYDLNFPMAEVQADIKEVQERINIGLFVDLFRMLDNLESVQPVTAAEIAERKEEKLLMLGPILQRTNDEMLDPLVSRTFNIARRMGKLPPPPPELAGKPITIEYISILAQAIKLTELNGIDRLFQFVGSVSAVDPNAVDNVDIDASVQAYADRLGVPPELVRDAMRLAKYRQQKAQSQQTDQNLQRAQAAAQTAQVLSQTGTQEPSALTALAQAYGAKAAS